MRQISLGNRGFGIAAPKAAVATLSTESVNAAKTAVNPRNLYAPRTTSTPTRSPQRPSSPQKMGPGSEAQTLTPSRAGFSSLSFAQGHGHNFPADKHTAVTSRPIVISKSSDQPILSDPVTHMLSGSILSSTLRPDDNWSTSNGRVFVGWEIMTMALSK